MSTLPSVQAGNDLVAHIKYERDRRGWNTAKLAKCAGMEKSTLYARFSKPNGFKYGELYAIAKLFNKRPQDLMEVLIVRTGDQHEEA